MKFSNVIAYCKNWYQHSGDVDTMWKDFAHCIHNDGWNVYTRKDVATWCLHRIDDFVEEHPEEAKKVTPYQLFCAISRNKQIVSISTKELNRELDDSDHIIWAFRDIFAYIDGDLFTEGVIPNEKVLPLNDCISDSMWEKCFHNYKEQEINTSYDEIEEYIERFKY